MAVRILMGKRKKKARNGYSLHEYPCDGNGYKEDYSEDEEDVFVEDTSLDGLANASKPLMHPRQRTKVKSRTPDCKCRSLCKPVLYFLLMVGLLGGLVSLLLYVLNRHKPASGIISPPSLQSGGGGAQGGSYTGQELIGCDRVEVDDVWVVGFPKLLTESAFRLVDVNEDGVLDVILGFATGADGYGIPPVVCDIYFNGTYPCYGGIMALEGATGKELWRHYSVHEIYALNCNVDLDGDKILDCLGAGRAGVFQAVSGRDGKLLWDYGPQESKNEIMNVYTPTYISDIDNDQVPDIVVAHGGDPLAEPGSPYRLSGRLLVMSGRTGEVLSWVGVPDERETYYSTQAYLQLDATPMVLFGTGGETHAGSLWVIPLSDLIKGKINMAHPIYTDKFKGVMTPPVLADLTGDGVLDIVIAPFNSTVIALDGHTYDTIWNYTFPASETYSTPAAGYYNDDDVPDFMVKFAFGPGFPVYYNSKTTVLDGKTGKPLLKTPVMDSVGAQASGLTISMEGKGHDLFLYWIADCLEHEGEGGEYHFVGGTNVHEQSRSDFCRLRFKTKGFSKLMAFGPSIKPPGATIYYSEDRKHRERQDWVNTTVEALEFLKAHPEHIRMYERYKQRAEMVESSDGQPAAGQGTSSGRRKGALPNPPAPQERYNSQYLPQIPAAHSPGAKKGPQLSPQRGGSPSPSRQYQQQQPPRRTQQQQQQPSRQRPYDRYDTNPFPSDVNSPYGMTDLEDSLYPRRGQQTDEQDDNLYGYPYGMDQQDEYSRYYPNNYGNDRYGNRDKGYGNRYQPYGNYYQKRDDKFDEPYVSEEFPDYNGRYADAEDILMRLAEEADASSRGRDKSRSRGSNSRNGGSHGSRTQSLTGNSVVNSRKSSQRQNVQASVPSSSAQHSQDGQKVHSKLDSNTESRHQKLPTKQIAGENAQARDTEANTFSPTAPSTFSGGRSGAKGVNSHQAQRPSPQNPNQPTQETGSTNAENTRTKQSGDSAALSGRRGISKDSMPHTAKSDRDTDSGVRSSNQNLNTDSSSSRGDDTSVPKAGTPNQAFHSSSEPKHEQSNTVSNKRTAKNRRTLSKDNKNKEDIVSEALFMKRRKRKRRHVGPHDDKGLQRLLSTGTIAPSTLPRDHPDYPHTIDVVFATYWFFPAKTQAILPQDQKCIADKLSQEEQRFDPKNKYYGMDHDAYEHAVTDECLEESGHQLSENGVYESQTAFNPYQEHMGQMTVYRLRLKCTCTGVTNTTENKRCARILPYGKQQWPAYMGRNGDSYWLQRT